MEHWILLRVRLIANDWPAQPHIVHALAGLDLDDLSTHIRQHHPRNGACQYPAEIQDTVV